MLYIIGSVITRLLYNRVSGKGFPETSETPLEPPLLAPILESCDANHIEEPTSGINTITLSWLVHILLPKLVSWAESWDEGRTKRESLIPLEDYVQLYHAMKKKYAAPLIEVSSLKIVGMWTQFRDINFAVFIGKFFSQNLNPRIQITRFQSS